MHHRLVLVVLAMAVWAGPAWALFESNKELANTAKIPMEQALKTALATVPGKVVEAEIGKEDGRVAYEVEIIDKSNKAKTVYVDAETGKTMKVED